MRLTTSLVLTLHRALVTTDAADVAVTVTLDAIFTSPILSRILAERDLRPRWRTRYTIRYDTRWYIYVRSQADERASLV